MAAVALAAIALTLVGCDGAPPTPLLRAQLAVVGLAPLWDLPAVDH